jgi:hypothetical protein
MSRKIILFELNEVPRRILDEYCGWHPSSEFARRYQTCSRYETITEDVGHLSPWLTWPTLHRGVNNERHRIVDFGQSTRDADAEYPPLWQILTDAGVSTGVGGSLHTYPLPKLLHNYSFYLPDTFAPGNECFPELLETFQAFNLAMARESARNVSGKVAWRGAIDLLRRAPELGFTPATFLSLSRQLLEERMKPERKIRRRTYQSVLAFDIFMQQLRKSKPAFSTFFTNHVASSMHRYWAATFPHDYDDMPYSPAWISTYGQEIDFAMGVAAEQLLRVFRFADQNPSYIVCVASSMGQAATMARPVETQLYVKDPMRFMEVLGFASDAWRQMPAMVPQFNVVVPPHRQEELAARLDALRVAGEPVTYRLASEGFVSIDFGQENLPSGADARLAGQPRSFGELGLETIVIQDKSGSCAYHISEGILLVYDPLDLRTKARAAESVSTLEIAPSIMANFGLEARPYMRPSSQALLGTS